MDGFSHFFQISSLPLAMAKRDADVAQLATRHPKVLATELREMRWLITETRRRILVHMRAERRAIAAHTADDSRSMFALARGGTRPTMIGDRARDCCWITALPADVLALIYRWLGGDHITCARFGEVCTQFARVRFAGVRALIINWHYGEKPVRAVLSPSWARVSTCESIRVNMISVGITGDLRDAIEAIGPRIDWSACAMVITFSRTQAVPHPAAVTAARPRRLEIRVMHEFTTEEMLRAVRACVALDDVEELRIMHHEVNRESVRESVRDANTALVCAAPRAREVACDVTMIRATALPAHVKVIHWVCVGSVMHTFEFGGFAALRALWYITFDCADRLADYVTFVFGATAADAAAAPFPFPVWRDSRRAVFYVHQKFTRAARIGFTSSERPFAVENITWTPISKFDAPYGRWTSP